MELKQCFQRKTMCPQPQLSWQAYLLLFIVLQWSINYFKEEYAQTQFWSTLKLHPEKNHWFRRGWIYSFLRMMTLKIRSRSLKSYQLYILPQWYNTLCLARIQCSIQITLITWSGRCTNKMVVFPRHGFKMVQSEKSTFYTNREWLGITGIELCQW